MHVIYEINPGDRLKADDVLELFEQAGISKPDWTLSRMTKSLAGCTTIVCAWYDNRLIGFASAISDRAWIAYISQLAVNPEFQRNGIGKKLIERILKDLGDGVTVVVHSSDKALDFYPSVGFSSYSNVFVRTRKASSTTSSISCE